MTRLPREHSAVSQQIRVLEEQLGFEVFEPREGHGPWPGLESERLFDQARRGAAL